jgi:hypothetical protein
MIGPGGGKPRGRALALPMIVLSLPFWMGVLYQDIVPITEFVAVIILIRLIAVFIRWRFRR